MAISKWLVILAMMIHAGSSVYGQDKAGKGDNRQEDVFNTSVPKHRYDVILARPTNQSITLSILSYSNAKAVIVYRGKADGNERKINIELIKDEPREVVIDQLKPSSAYVYRVDFKGEGMTQSESSPWQPFHTQRASRQTFQFTMMADSHLDQNADTAVYLSSLRNAKCDTADFHIDLGDTFMTDKYRQNYKDTFSQYVAQRYYLGMLCQLSPLFFVQGNHDGESGQRLNGTADNITVWSNTMRKKYFPNPISNGFYSGNKTEEPFVGQPQNYYSWQWGDALFVVLDPFWYTPKAGADDPCERTLGKAQYEWLKSTLAASKASFKFIFIHNLVGGVDLKGPGRGGSEAATLYEWGGKNSDGSDGFASHRPGWEMPIHDLLLKYNVTAVFHGHDHLYAHQTLDGIIYQCLPQPGAKEHGNVRQAEEYGYVNGTIKNGPGYLRVTVMADQVLVEYVNTDAASSSSNRQVVDSYTIIKK